MLDHVCKVDGGEPSNIFYFHECTCSCKFCNGDIFAVLQYNC